MRHLVTVPLLLAASVGLAETRFVIEPPKSATVLDVRAIAADGSIPWTCRREGADVTRPCETAALPASFVLLARVDGRVAEHAVRLGGTEVELRWNPDTDRISRRFAADPRVQLTIATDRLFEGEIFNGSDAPIYGSFSGSPPGVRVEVLVDGAWRSTSIDHVNGWGRDPLPPGSRKRFHWPLESKELLGPGTYRLVAGYRTAKPADDAPADESSIEVASGPFVFTPGRDVMACPRAFYEVTPLRGTPPELVGLHRTSAGILLLRSSGDLLRVDDGSMKTITHLPEGSRLLVSADGNDLLTTGRPALRSRDGGRTFAPLPGPPPGAAQLAFAGSRLLQFDSEGHVAWRGDDGAITPITMPVEAAWRRAAFRDERHGALLGDCSVLAETDDGGASWRTSATPWPYLTAVAWDGNALYLGGPHGVHVRRAGATRFETVLDAAECHFVDDAAFASCTDAGRVHTLQRRAGEAFAPLPVPSDDLGWYSVAVPADAGDVFLLTMPSRLLRLRHGAIEVMLSTTEYEAMEQFRERRRAFTPRPPAAPTTSAPRTKTTGE